ncbi:MAG: type IV pilus assembly protein PilM [Candidatus Paceibacterota bacterium]|jgi:type IV pilus assembly protein PilM
MKHTNFFKLFPVPNYLLVPVVGLDVSDRSIKYIELSSNGQIGIKRYGEKLMPVGVIEEGRIKNKTEAIKVLTELKKELGLNHIFASLPEDEAFIARMKMPAMKKSELRDSIELQLEEYIPLPPDQCIFDFEIISKIGEVEKKGADVSVSVLPKSIVEDYLEIFTQAGLEPLSFEIEAQAIARALIKKGDSGTSMIVDIGKIHTGFSIAQADRVIFTSTIGLGGSNITFCLQRALGLDAITAEKVKTERGLLRSKENQEVFAALMPPISALKDEIKQRFSYWQNHYDKDEGKRSSIDRVILIGGQSTLPGFQEYLEAHLEIPVELGDPWINFILGKDELPPIDYNNAMRYITALGLTLKNCQINYGF